MEQPEDKKINSINKELMKRTREWREAGQRQPKLLQVIIKYDDLKEDGTFQATPRNDDREPYNRCYSSRGFKVIMPEEFDASQWRLRPVPTSGAAAGREGQVALPPCRPSTPVPKL